jgi:hypothetical protein
MRALLVLLVACSFNPTEYPPPDELPAEYTACEVPEDCVIVELGCCDYCNGGEARSVNVDAVEDVRDRYEERCRRSFGCTLMACGQLVPTCEERTCGMVQDTGI